VEIANSLRDFTKWSN